MDGFSVDRFSLNSHDIQCETGRTSSTQWSSSILEHFFGSDGVQRLNISTWDCNPIVLGKECSRLLGEAVAL